MKIQIYEKLKSKIKNQSGMTLVELIVVFALLGIFMIAATFMLTTSLRMFERMQGTSQAVTVSDLILDKICGEIAAAEIPPNEKAGYYFWLEKDTDASWTAFCNRSGSPISMFAEGGELILKYYEMASQGTRVGLKEINWHFDKNVYMNYEISHLGFSRPDATNHPNVVKIDLKLTNQKTGFEYQTSRFAENYNFDAKSNYMCARNDGNVGRPTAAEEFKIEEIINPDNPDPDNPEIVQISFTVLHKVEGKETILWEEVLKKDINSYFWIGPQYGFSGYTPKENQGISLHITEGVEGQVYTLWYTENTYRYLIKGCVEPEYRYSYSITDDAGRFWGTAAPFEAEGVLYTQPGTLFYTELGTKTKALQMKNGYHLSYSQFVVKEGDGSNSPAVENGAYVVGAKSTYEPVTEIPYVPQDVTLQMIGQCGDEQIFKLDVIVKYGSVINLVNNWRFPGYVQKAPTTRQVMVNSMSMAPVAWEYEMKKEVNAPFPPKGPNTIVTPSGVSDIHEKFGGEMRKFFEQDWVIGRNNKNVEIAYHVFTYEGTQYAVAGYCEMEGNQKINSEAKWIANHAGVKEGNIINITAMEDGMKDTDVLWKYLVSQITDASQEDKNLILNSAKRNVSFVKRDSGNTNYYYLASLSYTTSNGQDITIKYE